MKPLTVRKYAFKETGNEISFVPLLNRKANKWEHNPFAGFTFDKKLWDAVIRQIGLEICGKRQREGIPTDETIKVIDKEKKDDPLLALMKGDGDEEEILGGDTTTDTFEKNND